MKLDLSNALLARARKVIPSASQTFSKGPNQWVRGVSPHYLVRGEGAWVWDADGNKYLDYLMALGPIILGYGNERVNEAVTRQLRDGTVFSQMHPLEVEVSELLVELIPCAEMVRFGKTGSDATTAAIRVSRAHTGRERVAICGYHGWHDWYIGTTTRDGGVPGAVKGLSHTFAYNDADSLATLLAAHPGEFAAVILEPASVEAPKPGFLEAVRDIAHEHGAVLIFDEVVSGFRFSLGGAQQYYNVIPDLACFGKAMANGFPLSAVVGKAEIMKVFDDIFYSGTFGGETLSLAACKATIEELREKDGLGTIWRNGGRLQQGALALIDRYGLDGQVRAVGVGCRWVLAFPHADEYQGRLRRSFFMQECVKRGLLFFGLHVPCVAHGDDEIDFTLKVFEEVMPIFAAAFQADDFAARMEGQVVDAIFRKP